MKRQYFVGMFFLCFFVWAILVDNAVLPKMENLYQDPGIFTRYRVKHWNKGGKFDLLQDELLIYAVVKNRELLYYMEYKPHIAARLQSLPAETPVQLRYVRSFPKFWKRQLYDLRVSDQSFVSFSPYYLIEKQKEVWKISGIMAGIYLLLVVLGFVNKPRLR